MERFEDTLRSHDTNLYSDPSPVVRMQHRPMHGKGFVGPKSTFGGTSQSKADCRGTNRFGRPSIRCTSPSLGDISDDELLLSSPPPQESKSQAKNTGHALRKKDVSAHRDDGVVMQGEHHQYHPDFKPKKLPSFKKNKSTNNESPLGSQSSQGSLTSTTATVGRATTLRSPPRSRAASPDQTAATTSRHVTKPRTTRNLPLIELNSNDRRGPPVAAVDLDQDPDFGQKTPRPSTSQRPRPRPAYKGAKSKQAEVVSDIASEELEGEYVDRLCKRQKPTIQHSDSDNENLSKRWGEKARLKGKGKAKEPTNPIDRLSPVHRSSDEEPPQRSNKGKPSQKARQPAEFPEPPPLSTPSSPKLTKKSEQLEDFPMLFPISPQQSTSTLSRQESQLRDFPQLPPLSSSPDDSSSRSRSSRAKSSSQPLSQKNRIHKGAVPLSAESDDDDDDDDGDFLMQKQLQPFPMQTQILESIGRSPPKRLNGHSSDLENEHTRRARKKRRADADPDKRLAEILRDGEGPEFDDDDMVLLGREVDPHTLCPWCDERLPAKPSSQLQSLIETARNNSARNPRPTNPLGLRAPVGMFVSVCQRHRFETHQVPKAQMRGWPTMIDWDHVPLRVRAFQSRWKAIIDDVDADFLPGALRGYGKENDAPADWEDNPRKSSVFWQDVVKSVRKDGSRKATGVAGQLANFSKTQPGYYGELGYMIISQTMYDMFPPVSFPPDSTLPLTPADFIQLILIPEAAVSLIMEDMGQTREEAIVTLRESAEYGVAMFPDDQPDDADEAERGEQIVKRRAQTRRGQLEVEERVEERVEKELRLASSSQGTDSLGSRPKPRRKLRLEATLTEAESEKSEVELVATQPSRKAKGKAKSFRNREPTEPEASDASPLPRAADDYGNTRRVTRSRSRAPMPAASSDVEMDAQSAPRPKPRPKRANAGSTTTTHHGDGYEPYRPSTPTLIPERLSDLDGDTPMKNTDRGKLVADEEPTPKPKKVSRRPLQLARERRGKREHWGGSHSEGVTEDECSESGSRGGAERSGYRSSTRVQGASWLLSDPDE